MTEGGGCKLMQTDTNVYKWMLMGISDANGFGVTQFYL